MMNLQKDCECHMDEDEAINKVTLSFIQLKEADEFRRRFVESGKPRPKHSNYLEEAITVDLDYMDTGNTEEIDKDSQTINAEAYKYSWEIKWDRMNDLMDEKMDESFDLSLLHYTDILRIHIKNRISLGNKYCGILFYCDTPSIVKQVFDYNLVEPVVKDQNGDVSILMSRFYTDDFFEDMTLQSNVHANLLYSYAIIFYRLPVFHIKEQILKWVSLLGEYINKENLINLTASNSMKLNPLVAYKAVVNSLIANGLFTRYTLDKFLECKKIKKNLRVIDDDSELMDNDESSDLDSFDSDMTDSDIENIINIRHINRRNGNQLNTSSLQNRISFKNDSFFPCSLKDLCRIRIKKSMPDYTKKTVHRLTILPRALKEFVLFNDRIDPILKYLDDSDVE